MSPREGTRDRSEPRRIEIVTNYLRYAEGSALYRSGGTEVLCAVSIDDKVKDFVRGQGKGWVTAEYAMLPRATDRRNQREGWKGRWPAGRSQEIQRLVGRSLRAGVWPRRLGERTYIVDCDVIQADGGTRTASINGGFVALVLALSKEVRAGNVRPRPLRSMVSAVSVGVVGGEVLLDLDYEEDQKARVDFNVVGTEDGRIIEVQGTAEGEPFDRGLWDRMLDQALEGLKTICKKQREALTAAGVAIDDLMDTREADHD